MSTPDAAEAFIRRICADHGDAVFGWAVGRFTDRRDAEEVAAETMLRAWRHHDQFDPDRGTERAWVFGIARTTAADHHRRHRRHLRVVAEVSEQAAGSESPIESIAEASLVRDALGDLTPAHRDVIALAHYEGLTVAEISARIGIPSGTVKSRLYYGMKALRASLEERGVLR